MNDLDVLERRIDSDLSTVRFPDREWVTPLRRVDGRHVYDVAILGAGHCGLTAAFALMRRQIKNLVVLDAAPPGRQGPWTTYARMLTLRSPKHFNGPDLDIPSLTCEAWYSAKYGRGAWEAIDKIPKEAWQDYLLWFTKATRIPVRYETTVSSVVPDGGDLLLLSTSSRAGVETILARKVVFATGADGTGAWRVPSEISTAIPPTHFSQVAQDIDFTRLAGARIGVLGGGASAYDNASVALERGARSVDLFFRRPTLHRVNPHKWTEFAGFLDHFRDLPPAWRWRFMAHILPLNEPPPPETFVRATRHPTFSLHLNEPWERITFDDGVVTVATPKRTYRWDHVFIAVGLVQDVALQKELASVERLIARWSDRYTPPPDEQNAGLAQFPFLGPHFEYTERDPGSAPYLRNIYNFTAAATVSHGPSGSSINGMKQGAQRLAAGICRDLFIDNVESHFADFLRYDTPELDIPWEASEGDTVAAEGTVRRRPA
jgi:cation diffusion facilitator CzcD-associated flavoprotein CzcO